MYRIMSDCEPLDVREARMNALLPGSGSGSGNGGSGGSGNEMVLVVCVCVSAD